MKPVIFCLCLAASTGALGVTDYDERRDGDLNSGFASQQPVFSLGYGVHTFTGSSLYRNDSPDPNEWQYDFDSIRVSLPEGRVSITYTAEAAPMPGTRLLRAGFDLLPLPQLLNGSRPCQAAFIGCLEVDSLATGQQQLLTDWPLLGTGEWYFANVSLHARGEIPDTGAGGPWDWRLVVHVSPSYTSITEPSAAWLAALSALLLIRRIRTS